MLLRDRGRLRLVRGDLQVDRLGIVPDQPVLALHDHLRRVDRPAAHRLGIGLLPLGVLGFAEGILPAEIIPVVDREAHDDHRRIARVFAHQLVGRRTRRTALAGEQFDHAARLGRRLRTGDQEQGADQATDWDR